MNRSPLVVIVDWCARLAWLVIVLALAATGLSAVYAARHFAIKTDINDLFPPDLPWTKRAIDYKNTFPQRDILVVIDAPTPEFAAAAASKLAAALTADHEHFRSVQAMQSGPFFARNGLLFLPTEQVAQLTAGLQRAGPLLSGLAADPSLRGALGALSYGVMGVGNGIYPRDALVRPMTMASDAIEAALDDRPAAFSWQALASGSPPDPSRLRSYIEVAPVVDYNALEPGRAAVNAIRAKAHELNLAHDFRAQLRETGLIPIDDAQFATLADHAVLNLTVAVGALLVILWLALRSWRIVIAALISVFCGLTMTAALGLFLVGALNLISVAFFVLFVGLGVDFGIQFSVRYRAERHDTGQLRPALVSAARKAGGPLALAAVATALGFAAFVPTAYRGLAELGIVAGPGMLIAFLTSVTLLPALLAVLKPPPEPRPMGFRWLAPIDWFLVRFRIPVVVITLGLVAAFLPALRSLPFDFDPIHMSNAKTESVSTFLELRHEPQTAANAIEIIAANSGEADAAAKRLAGVPEVARATTLNSFVPSDQDKKLALIHQLGAALQHELNSSRTREPPSDQQNVEALLSAGISLRRYAALSPGPGADAANRLFDDLLLVAKADPETRQRVGKAVVEPLQMSLYGLREELQAQPVTVDTLPPDLKRDWLAPDGRARVQVLPKGDPDDTEVLRRFVKAVTAMEPAATGPAVLLYEAGNTIVRAFIQAAIFAVAAIFILLLITLRRLSDVLLTLVPLMVAAVVTLELCVAFDLPLNFTNIIALPLLFGVGVAFKIYYIMAWRRGRTQLVQSTLSRAVIFSAMTTGTAFGSLWLSSHPGTSSMGQLMGLALLCTMAAAVLFQPALMGPPRQPAEVPAEPSAEPAAERDGKAAAASSADWVVGAHRPGQRGQEAPASKSKDETASHKVEG